MTTIATRPVAPSSSETDHERALAWARARALEHRHEIPAGSNTGPFVRLCQRATWLPGTGWPWCVAFFVAAWRYGAHVTLWWLGAGAYAFLDAARKAGVAVALVDAVPGDAIILNLGSGHCAMLAEHYTGGATVRTIDGNWSDQVTYVDHPAAIVRGCIHIPEQHVAKIPPRRPPMFAVATSASGHRKVVYVSGRRAIAGHIARILARFPRVTIERRTP